MDALSFVLPFLRKDMASDEKYEKNFKKAAKSLAENLPSFLAPISEVDEPKESEEQKKIQQQTEPLLKNRAIFVARTFHVLVQFCAVAIKQKVKFILPVQLDWTLNLKKINFYGIILIFTLKIFKLHVFCNKNPQEFAKF
jgi:hypothetical protein